MQVARHEFSNGARADLSQRIATIDAELSRLAKVTTAEEHRLMVGELRASWTEFVKLLAISPAKKVRVCPHCEHSGMSTATRCGYCWRELAPLPA